MILRWNTLYRCCYSVCFLCMWCRSLSTLWYRRSTQSGVGSCRNKDCTLCGWRETHPSPTSCSILKTQHTSFCTTCSCSASLTRVWYVSSHLTPVCLLKLVMTVALSAPCVFQFSCSQWKKDGDGGLNNTVAIFLCLCFHMQPLPEAKTVLYNQMTLRSLPEPERSRHSHAFKICKNFQVPLSYWEQRSSAITVALQGPKHSTHFLLLS